MMPPKHIFKGSYQISAADVFFVPSTKFLTNFRDMNFMICTQNIYLKLSDGS